MDADKIKLIDLIGICDPPDPYPLYYKYLFHKNRNIWFQSLVVLVDVDLVDTFNTIQSTGQQFFRREN